MCIAFVGGSPGKLLVYPALNQTLQPKFKSYVACKGATKKLKGAKEDEDRQRRRPRRLRTRMGGVI
jgi:hypothetical protein